MWSMLFLPSQTARAQGAQREKKKNSCLIHLTLDTHKVQLKVQAAKTPRFLLPALLSKTPVGAQAWLSSLILPSLQGLWRVERGKPMKCYLQLYTWFKFMACLLPSFLSFLSFHPSFFPSTNLKAWQILKQLLSFSLFLLYLLPASRPSLFVQLM